MTDFLRTLHQVFPTLSWAAIYNAVLLAGSLAASTIDSRQVADAPLWIKPIKFEISIIVFLVTIGWLLLNLEASQEVKHWIATGIALMMVIEITAICVQAARGLKSHFNVDTPVDGMIFGLMGIAIGINSLLVFWVLLLYFAEQPQHTRALLLGIRLGLVLFLLASAEGAWIVRNNAHTVGAPDGGPGLPFLNWSTQFGDLRVAHFLGMHAIQILPILGWFLSRDDRRAGIAAVTVVFLAMLALFAFTLYQALAQRPLLRL